MSESDQEWKRLAKAASGQSKSESSDGPPPGFASRIVGLRESVVALARVLLWRRLSVWVAALCIMIFVVVWALHRCSGEPSSLIELPEPPINHPATR